MICISYLDLAGTPSHLRYLLRRLRRQFGDMPLLVGLWPADDAVLSDDELRGFLGADHYASSLHDAVEACLAEAQATAAPGGAVDKRIGAPALQGK
jgi:hypothetical protein